MSQRQAERSVPAAESIEHFEDLYPRPIGINRYAVLSLAEDGFTAYQCDVESLECGCRDQEFNRKNGEICKHLATALYQADDIGEPERDMVRSLSNDIEGIHDEISQLAHKLTIVESDVVAQSSDSSETAEASPDPEPSEDPVEKFTVLLRDAGLDPADFDVWLHDEYGSLQVETTGYLDDSDFDRWRDLQQNVGMEFDADREVSYLSSSAFAGVL